MLWPIYVNRILPSCFGNDLYKIMKLSVMKGEPFHKKLYIIDILYQKDQNRTNCAVDQRLCLATIYLL